MGGGVIERMQRIYADRVVGQLVRYIVAGGLTTLFYAGVYAALAGSGATSEQVANVAGYLAAMLSGYVIHSRWSFRGHGAAASKASWRFVLVSLLSYASNTAWVWVLTDDAMLAGPWWWPLIPVALVTPLVNFTLNRLWVFG
jgi:putative flippase GtrA